MRDYIDEIVERVIKLFDVENSCDIDLGYEEPRPKGTLETTLSSLDGYYDYSL